jgi:pSer/pThr/pTyr-binding forkhead associated (FHA) protein
MLSVQELRKLARALSLDKFVAQLGPFALIRRPEEQPGLDTVKMGLPASAQTTIPFMKPDEASVNTLTLIFQFEDLEIVTVRPLSGNDQLEVGRLPDNDVVVDHKSVSKHHASLHWDDERKECTVEDHGSTNGTFLNASLMVRRPTRMRDGDIISFGDVQFWFLASETLHKMLRDRQGTKRSE